MRELVLARHAESEFNVLERLNGDATIEVKLTDTGREQARKLGRWVGHVDLAVHTEFSRTRETAELAWPGAPLLEVPDLNEFGFGRFEGTRWTDGFDEWVVTSAPDEGVPGGGESRLTAVQRFVRGYRTLLDRPEERIALSRTVLRSLRLARARPAAAGPRARRSRPGPPVHPRRGAAHCGGHRARAVGRIATVLSWPRGRSPAPSAVAPIC